MDCKERVLRENIYTNYEQICLSKKIGRVESCRLSGINRNVLIKSRFINDTPIYLKTFVKLCIGLETPPSKLLRESSCRNEEPKQLLERLTYSQLRALVVHAMSYLEAEHEED